MNSQDKLNRCFWCGEDQQYIHYHDSEWGYPVDDDRRLFEKVCLEGFQSGLSWLTILRKRENFRAAFDNFEIEKVAKYDERDMDRLLADAGIVRHKGKIAATINNAQRAIELRDEFGTLAAYFWQFEPQLSERPAQKDEATLRKLAQTEASQKLAKDMKRRGWKFFGPTTAYAFMQAMGLVNDHMDTCFAHQKAEEARKNFTPPQPK
ncbi:DNA-3-methyladenine glycosylase I [Maritalea myrionectae]|uniref:DNA-3-methyladenine glycosylase I n=1 Tax=Maritalea myrionectae TaxID=454601 RepID=A0A2R4MHH1_9HYPH|nr:DNA-3-methyladenine glycosylase I [Maritalea myrionectae]AVX05329.1 DNA-3-methyladenine glycosylase I [Maritalea myrionectae]